MSVIEDEILFTPDQFGNANTYLPRVIGAMVQEHLFHGMSCPSGLEEDEWDRILNRISGSLLAYADGIDDAGFDDGQYLTLRAKEALELFSHWFDQMWEG